MNLFDAHMHSARREDFSPPAGALCLSCAAGPEDWAPLLGEIRPQLRVFLGLHPLALPAGDGELRERLAELARLLEGAPRAGLGECGLDRRARGSEARRRQKDALRAQIRLARRLGRPLCLHQVRAAGALAELLEAEKPEVPLLLHGFRGKAETARRFLKRGAFLSFGPGRHWEEPSFAELLGGLPRERLLLESDWPFCGGPYAPVTTALYRRAAELLGTDAAELALAMRARGEPFLL